MSDNEIGLGSRLIESREKAGLRPEDVAADLHLDLHIIKDLESENFDALPEPTYVRGYIRSYSRLLLLNPDELLAIYEQLGHSEPEWEINEPAKHEVAQGRKLRPVTIVVFLAIMGLLITWLLTEGNGRKEGEQEEIATAESVQQEDVSPPAESVQVMEQPDSIEPASDLQPQGQEMVVEEISAVVEQTDGDVQEPQAEPAVTEEIMPLAEDESLGDFSLAGVVAEGQDRVSLTFNNDSWVEIVDANDVQVLRGLFKKGTVRELVGSAPFSVFLGNTQGVTIKINNKTFDPTPYTRRDSTSRFTMKAP